VGVCGLISISNHFLPAWALSSAFIFVVPSPRIQATAWPAIVPPTPGLRQARRKRLNARTGQDGTVYQEGRKQTDQWLPEKPAYLRIYLDIPGQHERAKHNEPLANALLGKRQGGEQIVGSCGIESMI
jgi:hypothetical protein